MCGQATNPAYDRTSKVCDEPPLQPLQCYCDIAKSLKLRRFIQNEEGLDRAPQKALWAVEGS